ncbi:MAG: immunoglobulin-like domain-containing protein [Patescibacteria group bacterium]
MPKYISPTLFIIINSLFFIPALTQASTYTVTKTTDTADGTCDVGDCSLREAVIAANANAAADTIVLGSNTYTLSITNVSDDEDVAATGDLDLTDANGVTMQGNGYSNTIISATGLGDRVLEIAANATVINVTLSGGNLNVPDSGIVQGGGVFISSGTVSFSDCKVSNNSITSYTAAANGGGVYLSSPATVTMTNCIISGNSVLNPDGAGMVASGGGIFVDSSSTLRLSAVTVSGNTANGTNAYGGGLGVNGGSVTITNATISGNAVTAKVVNAGGGAIYAAESATIETAFSTITNNTVSGGSDASGGGIYSANSTALNIRNSIVAGNSATTIGSNCYTNSGDITSFGYNIADGTSCSSFFATGDAISTDPLLVALADNGGPVQTHAISSSSPAKDVIPAVRCTDYTLAAVTTDARGVPRPDHTSCDIGAYELDQTAPVITVIGSNSVTIEYGATYTDAGTSVLDNFDDDVAVSASSISTTTLGIQIITFTATDDSGNVGTATRTVNVVDTTAPTITLTGDNPLTLTQGDTYTEPGYVVSDAADAAPTVVVTGSVDTATVGSYTLTYTVTDASTNSSSTRRTVNVISRGAATNVTTANDGSITITYADSSTRTFTIFSGDTKKPLAALAGDGLLVAVLRGNGRVVKLVDVSTGAIIDQASVRRKTQTNSKLLVHNFYSDAKEEIIIATRRNRTVKLSSLSLSANQTLTKRKTVITVTAKARTIKLKRKVNKVLVKQGSKTIIRASVQKSAALVQL